MNNPQQITPWIPVIATLCGALFGLFASFIIAYFNKSTEFRKDKEDRDRKRLERVYELVISATNGTGTQMAHLMNWIHSATPIPEDKDGLTSMPPLIELEMLVKLYLPSLDNERELFVKSIQDFNSYSFEIQRKSFRNESKEMKQNECGNVWIKFSNIEKAVQRIQNGISKIIKA